MALFRILKLAFFALSVHLFSSEKILLRVGAKKSKPNVILILTDDQGYGGIGAQGNEQIHTPNLNKLHEESTRLTNFHVDPFCSPTRAALLTGRYAHRVGVWHTGTPHSFLRKDEITIADVMKSNGYKTAIFGKWHLGDSFPYRPEDRGFEVALIHKGGGIGQASDFWVNTYFNPNLLRNGKEEQAWGFCTDIFFQEAIKFIEENKGKPFFVYLSTNAPHEPFTPKEGDLEEYDDRKELSLELKKFYALITNIDENFGLLEESLVRLDLHANTILIFTTDNGSGVRSFNAGLKGFKFSEYDGGHRVPMYIRWPKNKKIPIGKDIDHLAAHIDVLPTLIDFCKLKFKYKINGKKVSLDGISLSKVLVKEKHIKRKLVVESQKIMSPRKWKNTAVLMNGKKQEDKQDWRLVNGNRLYEMETDRGQNKNLYELESKIVERMTKFYDKWWDDVSAKDADMSAIDIGRKSAKVTLVASDWVTEESPLDQSQLKNQSCLQGYWPVNVEDAGDYYFQLWRWPKESGKSLQDAAMFKYERATIRIGSEVYESDSLIAEGDRFVSFILNLSTGPKHISAEFTDRIASKRCGAYFVYVTHMDSFLVENIHN